MPIFLEQETWEFPCYIIHQVMLPRVLMFLQTISGSCLLGMSQRARSSTKKAWQQAPTDRFSQSCSERPSWTIHPKTDLSGAQIRQAMATFCVHLLKNNWCSSYSEAKRYGCFCRALIYPVSCIHTYIYIYWFIYLHYIEYIINQLNIIIYIHI